MPSWKDLYGSNKFLNLKQLGSKTLIGAIELIEPHQSTFKGKEQTRLRMQISGYDGWISLNAESCRHLEKAYGDDYEEWIGKKVQIRRGSVPFGEGNVPAAVVTPISKK
jgi:hypothetical protein